MINGANHKGSTYHIGRMLAERLASNDEITEFFLPKDMPKMCVGCQQCFMKDEKLCPHYEFIKPITDSMDEADLLIFTSPVYVYHVTGAMKSFLDHYGWRWMVHRPEPKMFKKQAVVIATAAGAGQKSTCKDVKDSLFYWGVGKVYTFGIAIRSASWDKISEKKMSKIESNVKKIENKVRRNQGKVKPTLKTKSFFMLMRRLTKSDGWNEADVNYWHEKGWDGKNRPWNK